MAKVAIVAVVATVAFLIFRPSGASADKVTSCLAKSGATVTETRLLEGGENLPPQIKGRLLRVEKHNYDVQLGYDSGLLMLIRSRRSAEDVGRSLVAAEGPAVAQRAGSFVMYWHGVPGTDSAGIVYRCLH